MAKRNVHQWYHQTSIALKSKLQQSLMGKTKRVYNQLKDLKLKKREQNFTVNKYTFINTKRRIDEEINR